MRMVFINPFYIFSIAFSAAIVLFKMKLSSLFLLDNTEATQLIILVMVLFCLIFGFFYSGRLKRFIARSEPGNSSKFNVYMVAMFIIAGTGLEIISSGAIPFLMVFEGVTYNYREFGIASFHVFFLSYVSASAIIGFERYILFGNKRNLLLTILGVLFSIIIVNRAAMLMIILPCFFIYLSYNAKVKSIVSVLLCFLIIIITFGYIGDKRMVSSGYTDDKPLFRVAKIDSVVLDSLPSGFSWFYIYASSPYANLLYQERNPRYDKGNVTDFLNVAILPDFISKRIDDTVKSRFPTILITDELNATTGFCYAAITFGSLGVILLYLYMFFILTLFLMLNRKRHIRAVAALLSTITAFMIFENMLVFASCIMQLILITLFCSKKITLFGRDVNLL